MQKKVLCMHSLAGVGRCGLTVALPVLSSMGHEACCMATAALSTHTGGFGPVARADLDALCEGAADHYVREDISFDCIYAGYMPSVKSVSICLGLLQSSPKASFLLDPVMGDCGKMYSSMPKNLPTAMKNAAKYAHILTPNETEAALLLGEEYKPLKTREEAEDMLCRLAEICCGNIVITGIELSDNTYVNACKNKNGEIELIPYNKSGALMHGTGDLFASVLCGAHMNGADFFDGVRLAADFVEQCVFSAEKAGLPERLGIPFEPLLTLLQKSEGDILINV